MKISVLTISACLVALLSTPVFAAGGFDEAVQTANAEIDKAKAAGYEWRDSRKLLKQAGKAETSGNHGKAMKLADKARQQGITAVAQAKKQANAGPQ